MQSDLAARLRRSIRDIPDFPQPGVLFRDVTTLLLRPDLVAEAIDALWDPFEQAGVTHVVAVEARGFIVGTGIAMRRALPLVLLRKAGKLPGARLTESYDLEYGQATLEIHADVLRSGDRALIVDDVLATGGTACAAGRLVKRCGAAVAGYGFLAELVMLNGRGKLEGEKVVSLLEYDSEQ
jgi:adenine phosphoribosyltransferase